METENFSELFSPLFSTTSIETLEWLLSVAVEQEFPKDSTIVIQDTWGKEVYFVISGWLKVRSLSGDNEVTLEILSRGDCFGEMAVLEEAPRSTEVIALSQVKLLSISAQRFIQMLFKEPQLHHRLLQFMVKRLRLFYLRCQLRYQPPRLKLAKMLVFWTENYGKPTEKGIEIFNISPQDLADVTEIDLEETHKLIEKFTHKGWIETNPSNQTLYVTNLKQISHLAR